MGASLEVGRNNEGAILGPTIMRGYSALARIE